MKSNILTQIIIKLKENGASSAYNLAKQLDEKFESKISYHLKNLAKADIVKKEGAKYKLAKTTFTYNGMLIVHFPSEGFMFLNCPHFGECQCKRKTNKECKIIEELPATVRELIYGK